jgi:hypothetical protein
MCLVALFNDAGLQFFFVVVIVVIIIIISAD